MDNDRCEGWARKKPKPKPRSWGDASPQQILFTVIFQDHRAAQIPEAVRPLLEFKFARPFFLIAALKFDRSGPCISGPSGISPNSKWPVRVRLWCLLDDELIEGLYSSSIRIYYIIHSENRSHYCNYSQLLFILNVFVFSFLSLTSHVQSIRFSIVVACGCIA